MGSVLSLILLGGGHPNDGGLYPYYLIEVWEGNSSRAYVIKEIQSSKDKDQKDLDYFRVFDNNEKSLFKAIDKVIKSAKLKNLPSSTIAYISFCGVQEDKKSLSKLANNYKKHDFYYFRVAGSKYWNHWQNSWDKSGIFEKIESEDSDNKTDAGH